MNKSDLIKAISTQLQEKLEELASYSDDLRNALESEGKSTAGDKHDTGRAMIHLEQEKLQNQLKEIKSQIQRINTIEQANIKSDVIDYGSFVITTGPYFLLGIGLGKVNTNTGTVYCIGMETPIGKLLKGLKKQDTFPFLNKKEQVLSVE